MGDIDERGWVFFSVLFIPYNSNLYPIAVIITIHNIFMMAIYGYIHTKYNVTKPFRSWCVRLQELREIFSGINVIRKYISYFIYIIRERVKGTAGR